MPHFRIEGFETLPPERQQVFLRVPPSHLDAVRPMISEEIAKTREKLTDKSNAQAEVGSGQADLVHEQSREAMANDAIETFKAAERGDEKAKKDLQDAKKELLGEEPSDEDIFKLMLENESDPFAQDLIIETMLSDETSEAHQKVLDLFKDHRGDLASVDAALRPELQIEFFTTLTKGQGSFRQRLQFAEKALEWVMTDADNLFEAFHARDILHDGELNDKAIEELQAGARHHLEHMSVEHVKEAT